MNRPQEYPSGAPAGDEPRERLEIRWQNPAHKQPEFELADELVFCCLHQTDWRPIARPRIIALGLAACVLGQLIVFGRVHLVDRRLMLSYTAQPPATVLLLEAWEAVKAEHTAQEVKTWLLYLAEQGMGTGGIFARVTERMASRGLLRLEHQGFLNRRIAYVPTNRSTAAWPLARLRQRLNRDDLNGPDGRDAFLVGLLARLGLASRLADSELGRARLESAVRRLDPPIRKLLGHLDVVVGEAAMTQRP